jgi:hypothetical protein
MDQMISFPPDTFSFTPPHSPGYSTGNKPSPSYRELTPAELAELGELHHETSSQMLPDLPTMGQGLPLAATTLNTFTENDLPSLSNSCSSPAADVVAFDFSDLPAHPSTSIQPQQLPMKIEQHERNDFDNFLDYSSLELMDPTTQDFFM